MEIVVSLIFQKTNDKNEKKKSTSALASKKWSNQKKNLHCNTNKVLFIFLTTFYLLGQKLGKIKDTTFKSPRTIQKFEYRLTPKIYSL